jgi:hypothetical protein
VDVTRSRDFAEEVRETAQSKGKPVPIRGDRMAHLRPPARTTSDETR